MLKHILIAGLVFQWVAAKPLNDKDAVVTLYENVNDGLGNYKYAYQTSNGIAQEQTGQLVTTAEGRSPGIVVKGFYSFVAPDNSVHEVRYVADENGYRPQISIIPPISSSASFQSTGFDLNRRNQIDDSNDKTSKPTATGEEAQKDKNDQSPCVPTILDKGSNSQNTVNPNLKEAEKPTLCAVSGTNGTVKFNVDDRLGKAVMISILGTGG